MFDEFLANPYSFVLICLLIVLLAVFLLSKKKWKTRIKEAQEQAAASIERNVVENNAKLSKLREENAKRIDEERARSAEALRKEREDISAEREELLSATEKELLVRTVMALAGYATRLERIEKQRDLLTADMREAFNSASNTMMNSFKKNMDEVQAKIKTLEEKIKEAAEALEPFDSSDILEAISNVESSVDAIRWDRDNSSECDFDEMRNAIEELNSRWDYSAKNDFDRILEKVESISSD